MEVRTRENGGTVGSIALSPSAGWTKASTAVKLDGVHPLYLRFHGKGRIDLKTITFSEEDT